MVDTSEIQLDDRFMMMGQFSELSQDFLTPEASADIDRALLSSRDKFLTRVAIYSLQILKLVAQEQQQAIAQIRPDQVQAWMVENTSGEDRAETGGSFPQFFTQLIISSLGPLTHAAELAKVSVEELTLPPVIRWFERRAAGELSSRTRETLDGPLDEGLDGNVDGNLDEDFDGKL